MSRPLGWTPACGADPVGHSSRECRDCRRIYKARHLGAVPRRIRYPAVCVFCGLAAGNSLKVKVYRYPLLRHIDKDGRHSSVCIGSMGMCDRCVMEHAYLNERTRLGMAA